MNSIKLFLLGCLPMRFLLAMTAKKLSGPKLRLLGWVLMAIGISLLWLYFKNARLHAFEAGGSTWWAPYRLLHGMLYVASAIYAIQMKVGLAWIPLAVDVVLGTILWYNFKIKKNI